MALFGGGTKSSSTSTDITQVETNNSSLQGGGILAAKDAVVGGTRIDGFGNYYQATTNTTNVATDYGALNAGLNVAALSVGTNAALASNAITANSDLALASNESAYTLATRSSDTSADLVKYFGKELAQYQNSEQTQLGNIVSALGQSYTENNKSANQQVVDAVSQSGDNLTKIVTIIGVVASIVSIVAFFGKK